MLGKLFYHINNNFGKFLFKNPNTLYYNLFNKLHLNLIANKNFESEEIKQYINKGFFKPKINSIDFCKNISSEINKQPINSEKIFIYFKLMIV